MPETRVLVKLRPSAALGAAESRANLRPLRVSSAAATSPFALDQEPQWYVAEVPESAALPWDTAHARLANQLGIAESDVIFAEPDLVHTVFPDDSDMAAVSGPFAVGDNCSADPQDATHGKVVGQHDGWHLDPDFSQLDAARKAVIFAEPATRIAHFDTGYYPKHVTVPAKLLHELERNFVDRNNQGDASDPDNRVLLFDNSGHGTGTISILAGGPHTSLGGQPTGGAPNAAIVPLRIADSVVLFRTSSFVTALDYAVDKGCDVGTMSMGGLPSRAWRESVDRAYLAGFCLAAAAGNNTAGIPTRHIVYPARYGRVIAVCGVMADGRPYINLQGRALEGNFGPDHVMGSAISTYTPNIPWARFGCTDAVRMNGEGTSSATPQIAAAVALWYEKYRNDLPRDWRRVEAVRNALFTSAKDRNRDREHLGQGILQARAALDVRPRLDLPQTKSDNDSFSFFRVLTGLGIAEAPTREQMFNLELMQRWLLNLELQKLVPNPDETETLDVKTLASVVEAVIEDKGTSIALRTHLAARYSTIVRAPLKRTDAVAEVVPAVLAAFDADATPHDPPYRRLRVYASDPSLGTRLDTVGINETTLDVPWEKDLKKGPKGEYIEVIDKDPSGKPYKPVDLNDPRLLAQNGWSPSEGNPQFHQQMVYAVAMTTISNFERALGRRVLWKNRPKPNPYDDSEFVRRLTIRPHALRQANAFYSPTELALLFGYFEATSDMPGEQVPGSRVYASLSHDIVAHETTHAILDGMHRRFSEATNIDTLALHEGFADLVALFQHFTIRDVLRNEIARTRGDLEAESALGSLAVQFGNATGNRGALRNAIGSVVDGKWKRMSPDPAELQKRVTPHARGAILVAAVFDAFLAIYKMRTADLLRIYTGGTGVLPSGSVHPDLVNRLADEAAKTAEHVLTMCIRALDYVPPVDVTFFEYLRGIITADFDVVADDRLNYRVAFVEAFRRRGIYSLSIDSRDNDTLRTLSVDTLRWQGMEAEPLSDAVKAQYAEILRVLKGYADAALYYDSRRELFRKTRAHRRMLQKKLKAAFAAEPKFAQDLGVTSGDFEVHELRRASRMTPDGKYVPQLIVGLTQSKDVEAKDGAPAFKFWGGSTLVVDLRAQEVRYRIIKKVDSVGRRARTAAFAAKVASDPLRALLFAPDQREPFAVLHSLVDTQE
jgi:hypothetical protein